MFQPMVFQEGDYICKEGSQADEMFFLIKGNIGIYYGSKLIVVINEGTYFGEIGCIMGGIRRAGVKALSTCELQALSRRNLNILLGEYPEVGDELKRVARDRASAAKKGADGGSEQTEKPLPVSLVNTQSTDRTVDTPTPMAELSERDVESEIDAIVKAISKKLRQDLLASSRIPGKNEKDEIT